jgi:peptide chain release factor 1
VLDTPGEIHIEVSGKDLAGLSNEAGGHRIQRVPPTERKGRVHTSTVTVAITEPHIQQKTYKDSDLSISWFSGTGAGGQHRNKHQNSCRITHLPTGLVATAQCRSRQNSQDQAKSALLEELKTKDNKQSYAEVALDRKQQVGSGMRGDKIRTYRFQDDVVKDHITGKCGSVKQVLKGHFNLMW